MVIIEVGFGVEQKSFGKQPKRLYHWPVNGPLVQPFSTQPPFRLHDDEAAHECHYLLLGQGLVKGLGNGGIAVSGGKHGFGQSGLRGVFLASVVAGDETIEQLERVKHNHYVSPAIAARYNTTYEAKDWG
ncbi:MAG: hypothetical protein H7Z75_02725, partial [Ferruginibacter sp.]|nr:hypothetical protein [Cytophagales bacterium]